MQPIEYSLQHFYNLYYDVDDNNWDNIKDDCLSFISSLSLIQNNKSIFYKKLFIEWDDYYNSLACKFASYFLKYAQVDNNDRKKHILFNEWGKGELLDQTNEFWVAYLFPISNNCVLIYRGTNYSEYDYYNHPVSIGRHLNNDVEENNNFQRNHLPVDLFNQLEMNNTNLYILGYCQGAICAIITSLLLADKKWFINSYLYNPCIYSIPSWFNEYLPKPRSEKRPYKFGDVTRSIISSVPEIQINWWNDNKPINGYDKIQIWIIKNDPLSYGCDNEYLLPILPAKNIYILPQLSKYQMHYNHNYEHFIKKYDIISNKYISQRKTFTVSVTLQTDGTEKLVLLERDSKECINLENLVKYLSFLFENTIRRLFLYNTGQEIVSIEKLFLWGNKYFNNEKHANKFQIQATNGCEYKRLYYRFGDITRKLLGLNKHKHKDNIIEPPQPKPKYLVGNLFDVYPDIFYCSKSLKETYGSIIKLEIFGRIIYLIMDPNVLESILNISDKLFPKSTHNRETVACKGTFFSDGIHWQIGRKTLQTFLCPGQVNGFIPLMNKKHNIVFSKLDKFIIENNNGACIEMMDLIERLVYDTICAVGFDYSPNMTEAYPSPNWDPFLKETLLLFDDNFKAAFRTSIQTWMSHSEHSARLDKVNNILDDIIKHAKNNSNVNTHLTAMLSDNPPRSESNIRHEMLAFLVAGRTTSTLLLTWVLYYISQYPDIEYKLLEEINSIIDPNNNEPTKEDINKLFYMDKVLKESMRLTPPVQSIQRGLTSDISICTNGVEYTLLEGSNILININEIHHDAKYWKDPFQFNPDRFDNQKDFHPYQFIPFGGGQRLCVGNLFALTFTKTFLVSFLRKYFILPDTSHPVYVDDSDLSTPAGGMWFKLYERKESHIKLKNQPIKEDNYIEIQPNIRSKYLLNENNNNILIVYSTCFGTTKLVVDSFHKKALLHNINVECKNISKITLKELKEYGDKKIPILFILCTYNGFPAEDAQEFCKEITLKASNTSNSQYLENVHYSILGCGNSTWISTYQKIPTMIDNCMHLLGSKRILNIYYADKAKLFDVSCKTWYHSILLAFGFTNDTQNKQNMLKMDPILNLKWGILGKNIAGNKKDQKAMSEFDDWFLTTLGYTKVKLIERKVLIDIKNRYVIKCTIEIPNNMNYNVGDHIELYPKGNSKIIRKLCTRLNIHPHASFVINPIDSFKGSMRSAVQTLESSLGVGFAFNKILTVEGCLSRLWNINSPPSRVAIGVCALYAKDNKEKEILELWASFTPEGIEAYEDNIISKNINFLTFLYNFQSIDLPLERFIEICPPIQPRLYSIASCPQIHGNHIELCIRIIKKGLSTGFLNNLEIGELNLPIKIRSVSYLRPPLPNIPIILVCGGAGISPFMGLLAHRSLLQSQGTELGTSLLYYGCRNDKEELYKKELQEYINNGTLTRIIVSYSRKNKTKKEYVQKAMENDKKMILNIMQEENGIILICGNAQTMANDVKIRLRNRILGDKLYSHCLSSQRIICDVWKSD